MPSTERRDKAGLTSEERAVVARYLLPKYNGFLKALETLKSQKNPAAKGFVDPQIVYYRHAVQVCRFLLHHCGWDLPPAKGEKADAAD